VTTQHTTVLSFEGARENLSDNEATEEPSKQEMQRAKIA